MEDYSVHQLRPEDFDILIPLMKDCFGMDVNVEYFRWKFLQNPAGPVIGFYALSSGGECAAYYGAIPENYIISDVSRIIYQSCDTMTHSKHRRKGLFQKLAITCYEFLRDKNSLFVIGFGGGQSTPGFLKFGWRNPFDVFFHFKPRLVCRIENGFFQLEWMFRSKRQSVVYSKDVDGIMELFEKNRPDTNIRLGRTRAFIQWKLNNPAHDYQVLALSENGACLGYCIYYVETGKMMILDAFCTDQRIVVKNLFSELNKLVINKRLTGIVTFAQRKTSFSRLLLSNNFFINNFKFGPLHEHLPFIFYAGNDEMHQHNDPGNWSITALDHDAF